MKKYTNLISYRCIAVSCVDDNVIYGKCNSVLITKRSEVDIQYGRQMKVNEVLFIYFTESRQSTSLQCVFRCFRQ